MYGSDMVRVMFVMAREARAVRVGYKQFERDLSAVGCGLFERGSMGVDRNSNFTVRASSAGRTTPKLNSIIAWTEFKQCCEAFGAIPGLARRWGSSSVRAVLARVLVVRPGPRGLCRVRLSGRGAV